MCVLVMDVVDIENDYHCQVECSKGIWKISVGGTGGGLLQWNGIHLLNSDAEVRRSLLGRSTSWGGDDGFSGKAEKRRNVPSKNNVGNEKALESAVKRTVRRTLIKNVAEQSSLREAKNISWYCITTLHLGCSTAEAVGSLVYFAHTKKYQVTVSSASLLGGRNCVDSTGEVKSVSVRRDPTAQDHELNESRTGWAGIREKIPVFLTGGECEFQAKDWRLFGYSRI
ncbi:hypothetical protein C8Q75DRAFT_735585 [Abortiporus biennis]|nr:hypothetical protein C8Q75DRAFT_735585 [Abortiporus biennis]